MYHAQLTISLLMYCLAAIISTESAYADYNEYELKLLRLTATKIWYSHRNHIFEIDLRNRSGVRSILKWPPLGETAHCGGLFSNCIGYILYAVELKMGTFEICGILQKTARCAIYKYVGNSLKVISEERLANELMNNEQDSSLFYYTNDSLLLLKKELDGLPLILVRKLNSTAYSKSDVYQKMDAFWWRKQLLSRLPSVTGSLPMSLHALFHHGQQGYILYGEVEQNIQGKYIFARTLNAAENAATYVARFCINDEGLQMPEDGRFVLTTLFRLKLLCSRTIKNHRKHFGGPSKFQKDGIKTTLRQINFGKLMLSSTSHDRNGEQIITGLFTYSSQAEVDFAGYLRMSTSPMALCSFRLSDLEETLENSEHLVPWRHIGSRATSGFFDQFVLSEMTGKKTSTDELSNDKRGRKRIDSGKSISIPTTNGSRVYPMLTSCKAKRNDQNTLAIKAPYASQPVYPDSQEANAFIQSTESFVAMLVQSASDTLKNSSYMSNREVSSQVEHRVIYLLTSSGRLLVLLNTNEDIVLKVATEQGSLPNSESMPMKTHGAIYLLFWVQLLSTAESPTSMRFIPVQNEVGQSKAGFQSLVVWNAKGILITNMSECFKQSGKNPLKKTVQSKGFYFDQQEFQSAGPQENGVWQAVHLECHFLTMKENVSLETASTQPNCIHNSCAVSTSIFIFSFLLTSLSILTFIFSWMKWRKARMYRLPTPNAFVSRSTQEYVHHAENTPQSKKLRSPKSSEIVCMHVDDGTLEVQAILPDEFHPPKSSHSDVVLSEIEHLNEVQPRDTDNFDIHATLANLQARQKPKIIIENQLNNDVFLQITPFA